jgi:hypothetical protein
MKYLKKWSQSGYGKSGRKALMQDFNLKKDDLNDIIILLAYYTYHNYQGDAFVLFYNKKTDKLYEVNGSHCSCYGLEGQWEPEETSIKVLYHRFKKGRLNNKEYSKELKQILDLFSQDQSLHDNVLKITTMNKIDGTIN